MPSDLGPPARSAPGLTVARRAAPVAAVVLLAVAAGVPAERVTPADVLPPSRALAATVGEPAGPSGRSPGQPVEQAASMRLLLPDLRTMPPSQLRIDSRSQKDRKLMRFSNTVLNAGVGRLELRSAPEPGTGRSRVIQRMHARGGGYQDRYVGRFVFHPAHDHWHLENFARYELWSVNHRLELDERLVDSDKVGYCIWDNNRDAPGTANSPARRAFPYQYCSRNQGMQGLSVGWSDTYRYNVQGQLLDVTGLDDGLYALLSVADPEGVIRETTESNNSAVVYVRIEGNTVRAEQETTGPIAFVRPASPAAVAAEAAGARAGGVSQPAADAAPGARARPAYALVDERPLAAMEWPSADGAVELADDGRGAVVVGRTGSAWTLVTDATGDASMPLESDVSLRFRASVTSSGSAAIGSLLFYGARAGTTSERNHLQVELSDGRASLGLFDARRGELRGVLEFGLPADGTIDLRLENLAGGQPESAAVLDGSGRELGRAKLPARLLDAGEGPWELGLGFRVGRGSRLAISDFALLRADDKGVK